MDIRNKMRALTKRSSRGQRYPTLIFSVLVLVLTALSTHGTLDNFASERLTETTIESFAIYGVARGLNATISVVQSTEVDAVVVSTSVGEALDPVNDAIERFSNVMMWALGSVLLQGVVLAFVSSTPFKWVFALMAIITLSTLVVVWRRQSAGAPVVDSLNRFSTMAAQAFVLAAIVRFIVPLFVVVSYLAGQALLQSDIDRISEDVSVISEEVTGDDQEILDQLAIEESNLDVRSGLDPETAEETGIFDRAREAAAGILPDLNIPDFSSMISNLVAQAGSLVEYLTRLLVLITIKNIILPLVFLAIALKVIKPVTMRLLAMTAAIDQDLKDISGKTKQIAAK